MGRPPPLPAVLPTAEPGEELAEGAEVVPGPIEIALGAFSMDVATAARELVARPRSPPGFRDDCSGFVSAIFTAAGIPMTGNTASLYDRAEEEGLVHHRPIPTIGDIAFFDNTHDRNRNGRWDDLRTHIAVVVDIEPDGTLLLAHHGSERALIHMNLLPEHIGEHETGDGRLLNSWLRRRSASDGGWDLRLTGLLWSGFAEIAPDVDWETTAH
ncbi:MAG: CHAP domain-containing protein [Deltaproteobacteria bacterium]|nr:CHAP domain-containing protein [Deltaproteobacteria bacterium]